MDTLITQKDERLLKDLLALAPMPEVTLSYNELLGFLYGISITPDLVRPNEWIPVIFGEGIPFYQNEEQARILISCLLKVLNRHINGFHDGSLSLPFAMDELGEEHLDTIWEWTSGFEEALSLRPECWEENFEDCTEEEQDQLMYSLIVVEGVVHPDEAVDMFENLSETDLAEIGVELSDGPLEKTLEVQIYLLQALELSVETIQNYSFKMEVKRLERLKSSAAPFPLRSSVVGKKESCPCGSNTMYQHCCGKRTKGSGELRDIKGGGSGGKIIQVDFPKHHKDTKKDEPQPYKGMVYQLEITLAYTEPAVWRRIQVPSSMTLAELHNVIQLCMGWQDMHVHQFQIGLTFYGPQMADDYSENPLLDESRFQLYQIEKDLLQGILYTYDLGDSWEHVIMLELVMPETEALNYPVLMEGSRACPPESIGGVYQYQSFLGILCDQRDGKDVDLAEMSILKDYDPEALNIEAINMVLKKVYGKE